MNKCRICGRVLKNPKWRALGIGPVCARMQVIAEAAREEQPVLFGVGALEDVGLICERKPDGRLACNVAQRHVSHSPTGFECGYGGSGPADLALNVLAELIPCEPGDEGEKVYGGTRVSSEAWRLHQAFKAAFIATMPARGGAVPIAEIRRWLESQRVTS